MFKEALHINGTRLRLSRGPQIRQEVVTGQLVTRGLIPIYMFSWTLVFWDEQAIILIIILCIWVNNPCSGSWAISVNCRNTLFLRIAIHTSRNGPKAQEKNMFLTTKLNLLSGMIIGASAVILMKEMCKGRCKQKHDHKHEHDSTPMEPEQNTVS